MVDMEDYIFDEDGMPVLRTPSFHRADDKFADEEDIQNIFHVKGDGYDVTLSLARGLLTWTNVNPTGKKKGIFKGKKHVDKQTVLLKDVYGVKMKRRRTTGQEAGEGVCLGFCLFVVDISCPSHLLDREIFFEHPSESLCSQYVSTVEKYLAEMTGRPKAVKIFLQAHAGTRNGRSVYKNKVLPLFQIAGVSVDCEEVHHNELIKQEMVHTNLSDFDCIIAMGGDGTVNRVVDSLLSRTQKDKDIEQKPGFTPVPTTLPIGVIPIGTTNHIARSVMGVEDVVTSVFHIIMGHTQPVDICSTYTDDKFTQWCFNCQYGFAGNVLKFRKRYKAIGKRGLEPAFVKALTKAKLRPYKCDIEYIPATPLATSRKFLPCMKWCDVCWDEEVTDENEVTRDLVEAFDPLSTSNDSETLVDLAKHEDSPWRTVKGDFLNIALFSIPGRSDIAPRGLSKYTHLNDGAMDLVLTKSVERKEFIRMLKRLGNSKNQFDFPFVEEIRVKEVRFRLRLPTGFHYKDYNFSEIDYQMSRQNKKSNVNQSNEIIEIQNFSDDSDIEELKPAKSAEKPEPVQSTTKQKPPMRKMQSFQEAPKKKPFRRTNTETSIDLELTDSDDDDDDSDSDKDIEVVETGYGVRTVRSGSAPPQVLLGPQYRMTFAEIDRAKRKIRERKKEEKKKKKEEQYMKTVWNIDNESYEADEIEFRIHHGLVRICGQGIDSDQVYNDSTVLCIPRL